MNHFARARPIVFGHEDMRTLRKSVDTSHDTSLGGEGRKSDREKQKRKREFITYRLLGPLVKNYDLKFHVKNNNFLSTD